MNTPLGRGAKAKTLRFKLPFTPQQGTIAGLTTILVVFALWVVLVDNPMGGEPIVSVKIDVPKPDAEAKNAKSTPQTPAAPRQENAPAGSGTPGGQTITIIDGSSGKKHEVTVPGPAAAEPRKGASADQQLLEKTRHGFIHRIGPDGSVSYTTSDAADD